MHWVLNLGQGHGPCRVNHACVSIGYFIYSFGGYSKKSIKEVLKSANPIDVHVLNTSILKWSKRAVPEKSDPQYEQTPYFRYGHTCVEYNKFIYLWGGRSDWTNDMCNNLYEYQPNAHLWRLVNVHGEVPDGRDGHTACTKNNCMYIFGGFVEKVKKFSNDIYEFNFLTSTWSLIIPKSALRPYWRDFHTASVIDNQMYIFGGRMDIGRARFTGDNFYSNDLFSFDFSKKKWILLIQDQSYFNRESVENAYSPEGRRSHTAVVYNGKIIVFGGYQENLNKHFNDLHQYDPNTNRWRLIKAKGSAPSRRRRHGCCVINDQMIIFGGTGPRKKDVPDNLFRYIAGISIRLDPNLQAQIESNHFDRVEFERSLQSFQQRMASYINTIRTSNNPNANDISNMVENELNSLRSFAMIDTPSIQSVESQPVVQVNEPLDQENADFVEDNEVEFVDSDSDDLINEESDDDDDADLESWSDLHILDLNVPNLKNLTKIVIIKNKLPLDSLPKVLIDEISDWQW